MEFTIFLNAFFDVTVKRVTRRWGQTAGGAAFDAHFVVASDLDPASILDEKGPCAEEPGTRTVVDIRSKPTEVRTCVAHAQVRLRT